MRQAANYREMADVLAEAGCDLLVMEMMTDIEKIIGGCCGTTVHHIRAMVDRLPARPGSRPGPTS